MKTKNEEQAVYKVDKVDNALRFADDNVIEHALKILSGRMRTAGECLNSPQVVKDFFRLKLAGAEHEIFTVLWLDTQHRVIEYQELFVGTLSQCSVYPREVVKSGLAVNAAACIFAHNHPSGVASESQADIQLTGALKQALTLVDIRTLDHIIIGGAGSTSFAERGLI